MLLLHRKNIAHTVRIIVGLLGLCSGCNDDAAHTTAVFGAGDQPSLTQPIGQIDMAAGNDEGWVRWNIAPDDALASSHVTGTVRSCLPRCSRPSYRNS